MSSPCEKPDSLTDALADAQVELNEAMEAGFEALGSINSKIAEMEAKINEELSEAATEINDFQTKLNEALAKGGAEFSKAIQELNAEFGDAMEEAGVNINETLSEIGIELDKIPTIDELLTMGAEKLASLQTPNVSTEDVCNSVPKIELSSDGKAIKAPPQPLLAKVGPLLANFAAPKTSGESNPTRKAVWVFTGSSKDAFAEIKESYIETIKTKSKKGNWYTTKKVLSPKNKLKLQAETYYFYVELSKILGVELMDVHKASKAIVVTTEQAQDAEVSTTNYIDNVKRRYATASSFFNVTMSFEDAVKAWQKQYTEPPDAEVIAT